MLYIGHRRTDTHTVSDVELHAVQTQDDLMVMFRRDLKSTEQCWEISVEGFQISRPIFKPLDTSMLQNESFLS